MKLSLLIIASDAAPSAPGVDVYRPVARCATFGAPSAPEWTGEVWTVTAAKIYSGGPGVEPHRVATVSHWSTREEAEEEAARCRVVDEDDAAHTTEASVAQAR